MWGGGLKIHSPNGVLEAISNAIEKQVGEYPENRTVWYRGPSMGAILTNAHKSGRFRDMNFFLVLLVW